MLPRNGTYSRKESHQSHRGNSDGEIRHKDGQVGQGGNPRLVASGSRGSTERPSSKCTGVHPR